MQSRFWCWTLNNYSEEDYTKIINSSIEYKIVGKEVGASGTRHLQGYFEFKTNQRLSGLRKQFSTRIHWEPRKANALQASAYCKKSNDFYEEGTMSCLKGYLG